MSNHDVQFTVLSASDIPHLVEKARLLGLDDNGEFSRYSPAEMAEIYNGVGPDRFPTWFREFLTHHNRVILPAVLIHDLDYKTGGSYDEFLSANRRLGGNAIACVSAKYRVTSLKYWIYLAKIRVFVIMCNTRGQIGWNFKGTDDAQH